jgi:hypothetical protein
LSRQLDAPSDQEGMRRFAECAPESAGEMSFAELDKLAEIRDEYRSCDMTINISTHFARPPSAQASFTVWSGLRNLWVNLLAQQRGCFENRSVDFLLVIKLTNSRIKQRDHMAQPLMRPCRTDLQTSGGLANVHIHC